MPQDSRCHFVPAQGFRVTTCCAGLGVFQNLFAVWLMRTAFEKRLRARGPQARCSGGSQSPAGWPGAGWPAPRLAAVGLVIWDAGSPAPACRFHPLAREERPDFLVCAAQFSWATFKYCARRSVCACVHVKGGGREKELPQLRPPTPSQGAFCAGRGLSTRLVLTLNFLVISFLKKETQSLRKLSSHFVLDFQMVFSRYISLCHVLYLRP